MGCFLTFKTFNSALVIYKRSKINEATVYTKVFQKREVLKSLGNSKIRLKCSFNSWFGYLFLLADSKLKVVLVTYLHGSKFRKR